MSLLPSLVREILRSKTSDPVDGAGSGSASGSAPGPSGDLDFSSPRDNVYAFGKLWGSYGEPSYGCFHGLMFASIGQNRLLPLFGYAGTGVMQCKVLANGHVRMRGKETGVFTDPATGDVLESWRNPFTDERVEVFNFLNDRIRGELTFEMPRFHFGAETDEPTMMNEGTHHAEGSRVPFVLPWQVFGDQVLLEWDYTHCYTNPVDAERWPKAHTSPQINPSEHFTFFASHRELCDRDLPSASFQAGFSRLSPWWPWMRMGQSGVEGLLFGRMFSRKCQRGLADVPPKILAWVERHAPGYLEAPDDWDDGAPIGTWEAYAAQVPPEREFGE